VSPATLILAALFAAAPPQGDVGARIAGSAAAAQDLQGPMDGSWALIDAQGRVRFLLQIVDPASGEENLQIAWREPGVDGALGVVSAARRTRDHIAFEFDVRGAPARVDLRRSGGGSWRGTLRFAGVSSAVSLRRPG
jgi:hypothetical protein